jgi:hypothetical protein
VRVEEGFRCGAFRLHLRTERGDTRGCSAYVRERGSSDLGDPTVGFFDQICDEGVEDAVEGLVDGLLGRSAAGVFRSDFVVKAVEEGDAIADLVDLEDAGVEAIVEVGGEVGDLVGDIDELGFEGWAEVEEVAGEFRMRCGGVVAGVLDDTFSHCESEIESPEGGISLFKPGDDAEGMEIVVESEAVVAESLIESLFAGMAERGVPDVMSEGEGLGEFVVQAESSGNSSGDLGDFERMGKTAAEVVSGEITGEPGKDLSFSSKTPKRAGMEDASTVACEGRSIGMLGFRKLTGYELSFTTDSDPWREIEARIWWSAHPEQISVSGLVITQRKGRMHVMRYAGIRKGGSLNVLRITNVPGARCYKFLVRQDGQLSAFGSTILPFLSGARALR